MTLVLFGPVFSGLYKLGKMIIPQKIHGDLKKILDGYGVNRATLFADLDGLARYIAWERLHQYDEQPPRLQHK
jgi:hypothetical protein